MPIPRTIHGDPRQVLRRINCLCDLALRYPEFVGCGQLLRERTGSAISRCFGGNNERQLVQIEAAADN